MIIDIAIHLAYALIIICALVALVFGIFHLTREPKKAIWSLAGIGVVTVVFIIGYSLSSGDFTFSTMDSEISSNVVKLSGAGLITFYLLAIITIVSAVVAEIVNVFR